MGRALLALVVVSVLAVAGCTAILGSGPADSGPTLTPAPVTDSQSTTLRPAELPPGIAPLGAVDVEQLRAAHLASLANRSFTLVRESTTVTGSDSEFGVTARVAVEDDRILETQTREPAGTVETYFEGTVYHSRFHNATSGETRTTSGELLPTDLRRTVATSTLRSVGGSADAVASIQRNGT